MMNQTTAAAHVIDPRDGYCDTCQSFACQERILGDEQRAMQTATRWHTIDAVLTSEDTREDWLSARKGEPIA